MLDIISHQRNANQNPYEILLHTHQDGIIKKVAIASVGEDVDKLELSHTVGRSVKWGSHFGRQSGSSSES